MDFRKGDIVADRYAPKIYGPNKSDHAYLYKVIDISIDRIYLEIHTCFENGLRKGEYLGRFWAKDFIKTEAKGRSHPLTQIFKDHVKETH